MPLLQALKGSIRQALKYGETLCLGYPFHYAQTQDPNGDEYQYSWSCVTTPIKQLLGSANLDQNLLWNMALASRSIDRLILQPGQIFSFWNRVPHPTLATGFRPSLVWHEEQLTSVVGGGLSQISSTLFQSFLWADLRILERYNHSIYTYGKNHFFPLGQDATVTYGKRDLIVQNSTSTSLQLRLQVFPERSEVMASVWGSQPKPVEVRVESTVLEQISPTGEENMPGWRVETCRMERPCLCLLQAEHDFVNSFATDWQLDYHQIDVYHPYLNIGHHFSSSLIENIKTL